MYKIFRYKKLSEKPKGPPTKIFGTVRQRIWTFSVITPSIVYSNFRTRQMGAANFELVTILVRLSRKTFSSIVHNRASVLLETTVNDFEHLNTEIAS